MHRRRVPEIVTQTIRVQGKGILRREEGMMIRRTVTLGTEHTVILQEIGMGTKGTTVLGEGEMGICVSKLRDDRTGMGITHVDTKANNRTISREGGMIIAIMGTEIIHIEDRIR